MDQLQIGTQFPPMNRDAEISGVQSFIRASVRHRWTFLWLLLCFLVGGLLYYLATTPTYRADALLQVEERRGATLATGLPQIADAVENVTNPVAAEVEILKSRALILGSLAAAGADTAISVDNQMPLFGAWLTRRHGDRPEVAPAPLGLTGFAWGGERLKLAGFVPPRDGIGKAFFVEVLDATRWRLLDGARRPLAEGSVGAPLQAFSYEGASGQIGIAAMSGRPGTRFRLVRDSDTARYKEIADRLRVSEVVKLSGVIRLALDGRDPVATVAVLNQLVQGYVSASVDQRVREADRALAVLNEQLPAVREQLDASERALSSYRAGLKTLDYGPESEQKLNRLNQLEKDRTDARLRLQQMEQRLSDNHPDMVSTRDQLAALDRDIRTLTGTIGRMPGNQMEMQRLQREVESATRLYTALEGHQRQLRIARTAILSRARVVDVAVVPDKPIWPNLGLVLSVATSMAMLSFGALLLAFRALGTRVQQATDAQNELAGTPVFPIAGGPRAGRRLLSSRAASATPIALPARDDPDAPVVEGLRLLRANLGRNHRAALQQAEMLLFSAPRNAADSNFVCLNLALLLAASGRHVLVVDANPRAPSFHAALGVAEGQPGLVELLTRKTVADVAIRAKLLPNLDLLPAGEAVPGLGELMVPQRLREVFNSVLGRYDFVLIGAPPVLAGSAALGLAALAARSTLVLMRGQTSNTELRDVSRRFGSVGAPVHTVVLLGARADDTTPIAG